MTNENYKQEIQILKKLNEAKAMIKEFGFGGDYNSLLKQIRKQEEEVCEVYNVTKEQLKNDIANI